MSDEKGVAARLGQFVADMATQPLPGPVLEKAAALLFDAIGVSVAARTEITTNMFLRATAPAGFAPPPDRAARLWAAGGRRADLASAVAANGFAAHARFQDDVEDSSGCHPGSMVIPAVVGAAEAADASLEVTLRGLVAGYGVLNWLGRKETVLRAAVRRGFRPSPTFGPMGAAAGASLALGLPAQAAGHAVAMAACVAGGLTEPIRAGSSDFRFQNATAAWQGLTAALGAGAGLDGSPAAFESPVGFLARFAGPEFSDGADGSPDPESILDVWAKPFPGLGDNMPAVLAAATLRDRGPVDPGQVTAVRVHLFAPYTAYPGTGFMGPYERTAQAIVSTAYGVATMLVRGDLQYEHYLPPLDDPAIMALVGRTQIIGEEDYSTIDGTVEVEFAGGEVWTGEAATFPREALFRTRQSTIEAVTGYYAGAGADPALVSPAAEDTWARIADGTAGDLPVRRLLDQLGLTGT